MKSSVTLSTSYPKDQIKVLLLENIHPLAREMFTSEGFRVETLSEALNEEQLIEKIKDVHVLGIRSKTSVSERALSEAKKLLTLGCFCIGTNQVNLQAAKMRGIPVFNAPFGNTRSVAEMVIAEIIMLSRQLGQRNIEMHQGIWRKISNACFEVRGKSLGIIGYGNIGSQVSTLAEALGMRVFFYDVVSKLPLGNARALGSLNELLKTCDFVTLHVPATPLTEKMISAEQLALMKSGACLLNASRGTVVDISALTSSLQAKHLAGTAIDVFPEEPESNISDYITALQKLPNVILTPHIGGATEEAQANIGEEVPTTLIRFVNTGSTLRAVNFPEVDIAPNRRHRILNVHKNVPGVLREINRIISEYEVNIEAQTLSTDGDIGYLVLDTDKALTQEVKNAIDGVKATIRTRLLY